MVRHISYHNKCVRYSFSLAQNISLQAVHVLNNVEPCCYLLFSLTKLIQNLFHPLANFFESLEIFWLVSPVLIYLMFLSLFCETFSILLNIKGGFCFTSALCCSLLLPPPVFCSVLHGQSVHPHFRHDPNQCLHLKSGKWQNSVLWERSILYSPFYLS